MTGDHIFITIYCHGIIIVREIMTIDRKPGMVVDSDKISFFIKGKYIVRSKIYQSFAVIIEHVKINASYKIPLLFTKLNDRLSGFIFLPFKRSFIELIFCQIIGYLLKINIASEETKIRRAVVGRESAEISA